jgi:hypothetical protein
MDDDLRAKVEALAAHNRLSISSTIRNIIHRHIVALEQQAAASQRQAPTTGLQAFYETL